MGVCVGAYSAGLFHLMTHAFFKALLFMAAGSIIGAMAGDQSLDHMGGFRKALPFTLICFLVGGLALSGMPPFSGWLSKDDIIGFLNHRGGGFEILGIVGYAGAFLTAIYTFRMIFRAFWGEPCEEARELEHGHLHHADVPRNPMTGEEEDTDVGFPGPGHFIAEREMPMKIAMGALAVLAVVGGLVQIPGIDDAVTRFLEPTFADSKYVHVDVHAGPAWLGLVIGALIAIAGISIAFRIWVKQPGTSLRIRERFSGAYVFLSHKWYFDEIIDFAIVRPTLWLGRVVATTLERGVITGVVTDGTTSVVRAGSAAVRRAQTGFLRYYAALMIVALFGVALYFLVSST
jgi:NADH-quinone oxidoreductase subunit L